MGSSDFETRLVLGAASFEWFRDETESSPEPGSACAWDEHVLDNFLRTQLAVTTVT